jgi:hypothetical protein
VIPGLPSLLGPWLRAHGLDLGLAAVLCLELVAGYRAGLILTAAGVGGRLLAAVAAWTASPLAQRLPWTPAWESAAARWLVHLGAAHHLSLAPARAAALAATGFRGAAFLLLYWLITALILALARAATEIVRRLPLLGAANQLGGAVLGLAVSAVELGLLAALALAVASDLHAAPAVRLLRHSWLLSHLDGAAERAVDGVLQRWEARAVAAAPSATSFRA